MLEIVFDAFSHFEYGSILSQLILRSIRRVAHKDPGSKNVYKFLKIFSSNWKINECFVVRISIYPFDLLYCPQPVLQNRTEYIVAHGLFLSSKSCGITYGCGIIEKKRPIGGKGWNAAKEIKLGKVLCILLQ